MIKIHNLERSRSRRIVWLLEELDAPYELIQYARDEATKLAPESLKAVHPLGKSPVIEDGDVVLAESGAIVEYLVERFPKAALKPAVDSPIWPEYLQWVHYAEGSAMPPLVFGLVIRLTQTDAPFLSDIVAHMVNTQLAYVNEVMADRQYICGDQFTAADVMMGFIMESGDGRVIPKGDEPSVLEGYPHLQSYLDRITARPAYQRSLAAIGEE